MGKGEGRRDGCHKQSHAHIQGVDRVGRYSRGCWWPRKEHYGEEEVDAYSELRNRSCVRGRVERGRMTMMFVVGRGWCLELMI